MTWSTFWTILQIAGSLAFFIYGMKVMSEGIQRAAGSQLRNILRTMTKNRYLGVVTGFLTTAAVQSSSATTVMTVSFVNAGLITLVESAGIMMGANIGTTITGWLISVLGFKVSLSTYSIPLFALGLPMLFIKSGKWRFWGEFIIGFAILFFGLSELKNSIPDLDEQGFAVLERFTSMGIFSGLIFVLLGAILTIAIQSSSAAMALTLTFCYEGWLPLEVGCAMVLGENIGTTITAELASLIGNVHAKRSARIHSMFNIIGVCWMLILLQWVVPFVISQMEWIAAAFGATYINPESFAHLKGDDLTSEMKDSVALTVSAFHTFFNATNVILLIGFVPALVNAAIRTVKSKGDEDEEFRLEYIGTNVKTPELSVIEVQRELVKFGQLTSRMSGFLRDLLKAREPKVQRKKLKKLAKYEEITDRVEIELTEYLTKLSAEKMTEGTSMKARIILNVCNDLERIGDIFYQMSKTIERKIEAKVWFVPEQRERINEMLDAVDEAFATMIANLESDYAKVDKAEADRLEKKINKLRNKLRKENVKSLADKAYTTESGMVYNNLFSSLEKVGDHIINVTEAIVGEI